MPLIKYTGLQTMTGSEAELFNINKGISTIHFGSTVYLDEMASDDVIRIKVYDKKDGLAYWKFDNTVNDSVGTSNGTVTGTTTYGTGAIAGASFSFNGTSYIQMANEPTFDLERTNAFTIAFYFKGTNTGVIEALVTKMNAIDTTGYRIAFNASNALVLQLCNTASANELKVSYATNLRDGNFHHIVFTYDGSSLAAGVNLYVDGSAVALTTVINNLSSSILNNIVLVAGAFGGGTSPVTGLMDELRIYTRVLSASEVSYLFTNPANLLSVIYDRIYSGVQSIPSIYIPIIQTNNYAVTMQQTAGATFRTVDWSRYEVT